MNNHNNLVRIRIYITHYITFFHSNELCCNNNNNNNNNNDNFYGATTRTKPQTDSRAPYKTVLLLQLQTQ